MRWPAPGRPHRSSPDEGSAGARRVVWVQCFSVQTEDRPRGATRGGAGSRPHAPDVNAGRKREVSMKFAVSTLAVAATLASGSAAVAQTEIQFWHAFTGRLGELVAEQVETFNASQDAYEVVASHKGNYSETLNAGIAAFRAGEQPHILMVFEVGTATMMAAQGAIKPVYEVMDEGGAEWNPDDYVASVKGYYTTTDGRMLSMPYNSSAPVLWVNRDMMNEAGIPADADLTTWQAVDA